ncbi:shikimate dehydrogenase [Pseudemcibacter aquimaris]|uniref:shikimate dehydrogenase n=1 Tax=Pseudemcibacter aquimaris TaxID=2857064 RepID=UPI0020116488|nr:shikimate dehydrogenase [Pseudemcibacter aquimaris]MCC3861826.1 shikimate dehydrogenase [Pseudemcibacter aquimaris]WDU58581.1 shikimate dehydrogenase [Pseudemcibacter aquimaris]
MTENNKLIAGVVGDPISHSLSPKLHGFWLNKYGINGEYKAFHVTADELPNFLLNLSENGISGVNLTVPHKEQALGLVDIVDESAKKIGAVNTVYFKDGKMIGANTDGIGYLMHLKQSSNQWKAGNGPAVILGAGGAARAVLVSLLDDGVPEIRITNRTKSRAEALAAEIGDDRIKVIDWEDRDFALKGAALLTNVTTLGMTGQRPLEISLENLPTSATVYDIVYAPLETELLKSAKERGNETVDGLGMLLHQAVPGFEAWFGKKPIVDEALNNHLLEALKGQ